MLYGDLNQAIRRRVEFDQPRQRMLRYALDAEILTEEAYKGFADFIAQQKDPVAALKNIPWFVRLYWTRAFFEYGNGCDIWKSFYKRFPDRVRLSYRQLHQIARLLPVPFSCRNDFLQECWLVGGGHYSDLEAGNSSEIWKFLTPLIRRLPIEVSTSNENVTQTVQDYAESHEIPAYFSTLIQARDQSFLDSLRVMRADQGEGWLTRVAPLWQCRADRPAATAQWMLYKNGSLLRLDLVVDNIYVPDGGNRSLTVKPSDQEISCSIATDRDMVFFTQDELWQAGVDIFSKMTIRLGNIKVDEVDWLGTDNNPTLFRFPESANWLPRVEAKSHIYARNLVVLWPPGIKAAQALQYNGKEITVAILGSVQVAGGSPSRLAQLVTFDDLAGHEPQPLIWQGQDLLHIGGKPYLEVESAGGGFRCLEHERAVVVFDGRAQVSIRNLPPTMDLPAWICPAGMIADHGTQITVTPNTMGTPVDITYGQARITILFLPQGALDGAAQGWSWTTCKDGPKIVQFARKGLEVGSLANENLILRLTKPLTRILWWWEKGITGNIEFLTQSRDFDDYAKLIPYRLCLWVPDGQTASLIFNDQKVGEIRGPKLYTELVFQLLQGRLRFAEGIGDAAIDVLRINETDIANIMHQPNRPALTIHRGRPYIFFPTNGFDPAEYSVVCCYESGLVNDSVQTSSCQGYECEKLTRFHSVYEGQHGEGLYLLLVHDANPPTSLSGFAFGQYHVEDCMVWQAPDTTVMLRNRLAASLTIDQETSVRIMLDALGSSSNSLVRNGVFSQAVDERESLSYSNSPEFWENYFSEHCQLEAPQQERGSRGRGVRNTAPSQGQSSPLEVTLGLMLRAGFNWCSETEWFPWAHGKILSMLNQDRQRPRRQLTDKEFKALKEICPAILAQLAIEAGFPNEKCDQDKFPCPGLNMALLNPPQNTLSLRCSSSTIPIFSRGICLRGVGTHGIKLESFNQIRKVDFQYHGHNNIEATDGRHPFEVTVENDIRFIEFMTDEMQENSVPLLNSAQQGKLSQVYSVALNSASAVLGSRDDHGLCYMFTLMEKGFKELSEQDQSQVNRLAIFQVAVLSRLHAWLGWDGTVYPQDWPLSTPESYNRVCAVVREAWARPACKNALIKDLIPVEWMLAWFHR